MNLDLQNKSVVVTGGTKGLGAAIVSAFLQEGANVITNYHRDHDAAKALLETNTSENRGRLFVYQLDISSQKDAIKLIELTIREFGGVDILINNAAVIDNPQTDVFTFVDDDFDYVFRTNVRGLFYVTRAALAVMLLKGKGRIVNMSSAGVYTGNPKEALYASSKAGVEAATRAFAALGAKHGITVNAIAPHVIATGMALEKSDDPNTLVRIPVGRAGKPEEVAALTLYLSSDLSAYITGTVIGIDGGRLVAR